MIQKHLTATNSSKYINILQELINEYNNRTHSTIKMSPFEATKPENKKEVLKSFKLELTDEKPKFNIGDRVRIYAYKTLLIKDIKRIGQGEIFIITDIKRSDKITYTIKDLKNEPILGSFYAEELQKTKF